MVDFATEDFFKQVSQTSKTWSRRWLMLGVFALGLSGIFAFLLATSRTPLLQNIVPYKDFFHTALIVHVNLSVLVWLLCFAAIMWTLNKRISKFSEIFTFSMSACGTVLMAASAFTGEGNPLMNNYVPILQNDVFYWGLGLFLLGIFLKVCTVMFFRFLSKDFSNALALGIDSAALISIVAFICFYLSYANLHTPELNDIFSPEDYYELLYWGFGHVLQFTYTTLMVICWVILLVASGFEFRMSERFLKSIFFVNLTVVIFSFFAYTSNQITDAEYKTFFTNQMIFFGSLPAVIITFAIIFSMIKRKEYFHKDIYFINLACSLVLFFVGGLIATNISEINTMVPAHYHGSIVGVTIAFMGVTYILLPKLGFGEVSGRLPVIQPLLYGGGQLLHIIGFAISGGYGAMRKDPTAMQSLSGQISMGVMGLGGLVSIIGGLLFLVIVIKAIRKN
jgi:uncharacterized membrane protein YozB (DUF420 family)